ncbi:hypothetical protein BGL78_03210 [Helicobacter pylori]|nr:hypothetical protein BGL78_03210 [Helicobacter pylori]
MELPFLTLFFGGFRLFFEPFVLNSLYLNSLCFELLVFEPFVLVGLLFLMGFFFEPFVFELPFRGEPLCFKPFVLNPLS